MNVICILEHRDSEDESEGKKMFFFFVTVLWNWSLSWCVCLVGVVNISQGSWWHTAAITQVMVRQQEFSPFPSSSPSLLFTIPLLICCSAVVLFFIFPSPRSPGARLDEDGNIKNWQTDRGGAVKVIDTESRCSKNGNCQRGGKKTKGLSRKEVFWGDVFAPDCDVTLAHS